MFCKYLTEDGFELMFFVWLQRMSFAVLGEGVKQLRASARERGRESMYVCFVCTVPHVVVVVTVPVPTAWAARVASI